MIASVALLALAPLGIVIALAVRLTSRGPALHRATRIGKDGRPFTLYKFRSMRVSRDGDQPRLTRAGDPRITPIGRVLRRFKLDELPQLFSVVRGDMSLVGPRPEDAKYVALYSSEEREVLSVRPGMTSLVSLDYRDEEAQLARDDWEEHYVRVILPDKLRREREYLSRRTLRSDFAVIVKTVASLLRR